MILYCGYSAGVSYGRNKRGANDGWIGNTHASAETMATLLCTIINDNQKSKRILRAAMEALELCLEQDGLTFTSEHAADRPVRNIKKIIR